MYKSLPRTSAASPETGDQRIEWWAFWMDMPKILMGGKSAVKMETLMAMIPAFSSGREPRRALSRGINHFRRYS